MPMGDGSGPAGYGPGTGRGAGFCYGFDRPGSFNKGGFGRGNSSGNGGLGRGNGFRRAYGMGRPGGGYRAMGFHPMGIQRISDDDYKNMLSEEAEYLEKRLSEIKDQMSRKNGDKE